VVPCPPPLTALLQAHIQEFGLQPDGRLLVGERNGGELPTMTIGRVWRHARQAAFTASARTRWWCSPSRTSLSGIGAQPSIPTAPGPRTHRT
jgi:hypothetical protein